MKSIKQKFICLFSKYIFDIHLYQKKYYKEEWKTEVETITLKQWDIIFNIIIFKKKCHYCNKYSFFKEVTSLWNINE